VVSKISYGLKSYSFFVYQVYFKSYIFFLKVYYYFGLFGVNWEKAFKKGNTSLLKSWTSNQW